MDKFDRIYELHGILANRKTVISAQDIAARMECTAATVKRIIRLLRQSLNARLTAKGRGTMQGRSFMQTIQGIIGGRAVPLDNVAAKAKQHISLQHSAIAGFQYQQGEKFWLLGGCWGSGMSDTPRSILHIRVKN